MVMQAGVAPGTSTQQAQLSGLGAQQTTTEMSMILKFANIYFNEVLDPAVFQIAKKP
jgi:hypothetical protein